MADFCCRWDMCFPEIINLIGSAALTERLRRIWACSVLPDLPYRRARAARWDTCLPVRLTCRKIQISFPDRQASPPHGSPPFAFICSAVETAEQIRLASGIAPRRRSAFWQCRLLVAVRLLLALLVVGVCTRSLAVARAFARRLLSQAPRPEASSFAPAYRRSLIPRLTLAPLRSLALCTRLRLVPSARRFAPRPIFSKRFKRNMDII